MQIELKTYETATQIARRAGVHRSIVFRLISQKHLTPQAYYVSKGEPSPLFLAEAAIDVLKFQKNSRNSPQSQ